MDTLRNQFYDVMHKYRKSFSQKGVQKNLDEWRRNKENLRELLRRHPDWNEREQAVEIKYDEVRAIDPNCVREAVYEMKELAELAGLVGEPRRHFEIALDAATGDYQRIPEEDQLSTIRVYGGIDCAPGQKASRIVNRLCLKFGLERYTEEKQEKNSDGIVTTRTVHPYNAVFARLSDALNPGAEVKKALLSIHPCDFLEMSNTDNSWHSCHNLKDGDYQAGTLSYMCDEVSMVFYTVNSDVTQDFHKAPHIAREIYCYSGGTLLQSRLYPSDRADQRERYLELVQKVIASCLGVPGEWVTQAVTNGNGQFWRSGVGSRQYRDYDYGYAIVSLLQNEGRDGDTMLTIGHKACCVCCGEDLRDSNMIDCGRCHSLVICKSCGREMDKDDTSYDEEARAYYCGDCRPICTQCHKGIAGTVYHALWRGKVSKQMCQSCYEKLTAACHSCTTAQVCRVIGGLEFCHHSEWLPEAA